MSGAVHARPRGPHVPVRRRGTCAPPNRQSTQWTGLVLCGYVTSVAAYSIRVPAYLHG